jgi:hypothetical protein
MQHPPCVTDRVAGIEQVAPLLPVAVPHHLPPGHSPDGAGDHPWHHDVPGEIQPDQVCGAHPEGRARFSEIIAIGHPARHPGHLRQAVLHCRLWRRRPAGPPVDGIQLQMRQGQISGEAPGQGGFPGPWHADHHDPQLIHFVAHPAASPMSWLEDTG